MGILEEGMIMSKDDTNFQAEMKEIRLFSVRWQYKYNQSQTVEKKYLRINIRIYIPPAVFAVEALKKALLSHGAAWTALTPWTLDTIYQSLLWPLTVTPFAGCKIHAQPYLNRCPQNQVTHSGACAVIWCSTHVLRLHRSAAHIPRSPWEQEKRCLMCCLMTKHDTVRGRKFFLVAAKQEQHTTVHVSGIKKIYAKKLTTATVWQL